MCGLNYADRRYDYERELVDDLRQAMTSTTTPWGPVRHTPEFGYVRGRADLIALDSAGKVIAFEAKLSSWRQALHQAYRNTCFAHRSYVVVPAELAEHARRRAHEFAQRSVGLCVVVGTSVEILLDAEEGAPLQPWLTEAAADHVNRHAGN